MRVPVVAAIVVLLCTVSTAQAVTVEEVGDGGLRSPRHLDFAPSGNLFVAEAGRGGAGPCFIGGEGPACMGATAAVTRISKHGQQTRIVDGLPSYANDTDGDGTLEPGEGDSGIGAHGITALSDHAVFLTSGGPTAPRDADRQPALARGPRRRELRGTLVRPVAVDLRAAAVPLGRRHLRLRAAQEPRRRRDRHQRHRRAVRPAAGFAISDAGGNSVLTAFGPHLRTLSVFPDTPGVPNPFVPGETVDMQAVPTGIVEGPDGAYYMSQLTGFPFPAGGASVYRINPRTGAVQASSPAASRTSWTSRSTSTARSTCSRSTPTGCSSRPAFGSITAISKRGVRSVIVPPDGTLTEPGGIAVGKHGDLFVTNFARSPDEGQVLRISR